MVKYQRIDVYGCTVVFMGEPTKVEFELMYHDNVERITDDEYKRMYHDIFENKKCGGFTVPLDYGDYVCCIKDVMAYDYVAHEIYHTATRILLSRGVELQNDNDEPFAYLVGYLTSMFYQSIIEEKLIKIERLKERNKECAL